MTYVAALILLVGIAFELLGLTREERHWRPMALCALLAGALLTVAIKRVAPVELGLLSFALASGLLLLRRPNSHFSLAAPWLSVVAAAALAIRVFYPPTLADSHWLSVHSFFLGAGIGALLLSAGTGALGWLAVDREGEQGNSVGLVFGSLFVVGGFVALLFPSTLPLLDPKGGLLSPELMLLDGRVNASFLRRVDLLVQSTVLKWGTVSLAVVSVAVGLAMFARQQRLKVGLLTVGLLLIGATLLWIAGLGLLPIPLMWDLKLLPALQVGMADGTVTLVEGLPTRMALMPAVLAAPGLLLGWLGLLGIYLVLLRAAKRTGPGPAQRLEAAGLYDFGLPALLLAISLVALLVNEVVAVGRLIPHSATVWLISSAVLGLLLALGITDQGRKRAWADSLALLCLGLLLADRLYL